MSKVLTRRDFLKLTASGALGLVLSELGAGNDDGYIRIADNEVVLPDQQLDPLNLVTNEQLEQKRMNWRKWIPPEFEPQTQVEKDCRITRYLGTPLVEEIDKDIQNSVPGYAIILPELLEIRLGGILDPQKRIEELIKTIPCCTREDKYPLKYLVSGERGERAKQLYENMNNAQNKYDLYEILRIEYELMIMSNHPMKEQIEIELKKLNEQVMPQYLSKYVLPYFNELLANYSPKYLCFTKDAHPELDDKEIVIKNTGITNCYLWVTHIVSNLLKVNRRENMSPVILKGETGLQEYYISSNADSKLTFSEFVNWFDNNAQKNGWKDYTNLGYDKLVSDWDNQLYVAFFRNREDGHSFMLRKVKNDKGEFVLMKATFDGALPKGEHFAPVDKEEFERMCDTVDLHIYGCPIV